VNNWKIDPERMASTDDDLLFDYMPLKRHIINSGLAAAAAAAKNAMSVAQLLHIADIHNIDVHTVGKAKPPPTFTPAAEIFADAGVAAGAAEAAAVAPSAPRWSELPPPPFDVFGCATEWCAALRSIGEEEFTALHVGAQVVSHNVLERAQSVTPNTLIRSMATLGIDHEEIQWMPCPEQAALEGIAAPAAAAALKSILRNSLAYTSVQVLSDEVAGSWASSFVDGCGDNAIFFKCSAGFYATFDSGVMAIMDASDGTSRMAWVWVEDED